MVGTAVGGVSSVPGGGGVVFSIGVVGAAVVGGTVEGTVGNDVLHCK